MTITAPWRDDAGALLRTHPDPMISAEADTPAGVLPLRLAAGSELVWDETQAPRVSGRLVIAPPETSAQVAALDPRTAVRVRISAGYRRPGGVLDVWPLADLGLRARRLPGTDLTLDIAGDEALVIDAAASVGDTIATASTAAGITQMIAATITPTPLIGVTAAGPAVSMTPVTDRWSAIRDMCEAAGIAAYDAGLRRWVIETRPTLTAGESAAILATGPTGTVTAWEEETTRDDWFNYVRYVYEWRGSSGVEQRIVATAYVATGPYAITAAGRRIYAETRDVPATQATANAAAADALSRMASRGRTVTVTAIAAWWLRPGHTVTLQGPSGTQERHLVQRVAFDLARGLMTVTTREPVAFTSGTTTPVGSAATPDPTPTTKTTYASVWTANASATYRGDGAKRVDTTRLVQGYTPAAPANGNGTAIALFTAANSIADTNVTGEAGRTIAAALVGATVVRVELELTFDTWTYAGGGTARIGRHTASTIPTTFTAASPTLSAAGWAPGITRWVDVTAITDKTSLAAGTHGWTIGPGIGTDGTYYGTAHGHTDPSPPRLRITYAR